MCLFAIHVAESKFSNSLIIHKENSKEINVYSSLYADVNGFLNPSILTGENYCPDNNNNNCLFTNPNRKSEKEIKEVIPF